MTEMLIAVWVWEKYVANYEKSVPVDQIFDEIKDSAFFAFAKSRCNRDTVIALLDTFVAAQDA